MSCSRIGWCVLVLSLAACAPKPTVVAPETPAPAETTSTILEPAPPGVVELASATAKYGEDHHVQFQIPYKFTTGTPVKYYQIEINFPGTTHRGFRPLESWELKPEGVVKTGIQLPDDAASEFSITFAEADSPDRGYKVISNTVTGMIEAARPAE